MITRNMKTLTAMMLQSTSKPFGSLPVLGVNSVMYYTNGAFIFPNSRVETFTLKPGDAGVSFGTGSTPPTENDVNLENTITEGIGVSLTNIVPGCDAPGDPFLQYIFTITNAGSEALTIREVGYKQSLRCATKPGRANGTDVVCLLDRTLLDTPLEIAPTDAAVLVYKLKTNPQPTKVIGGVELVSFEWGSDAQIAAMIDAAHAGTIDLQRDAGWRVGNMRTIHIDAFTGSNNTAHEAQDIDIAISSFDDYNNCGCVLQFDFAESLATEQQMHGVYTNVGGYGASDMKTITLPALADALPDWLRTRLIAFDVLCSEGNGSEVIETVSGNKLALRSEKELLGEARYSCDGEGDRLGYFIPQVHRIKPAGYAGDNKWWWTRSPRKGNNVDYILLTVFGDPTNYPPTYSYGCAPFGCI